MKKKSVALDFKEVEAFQKREWFIQRVVWAFWALLLIAGLLGIFGQGPLSYAKASSDDNSIVVQYDRFLHYHRPTAVEVFIDSIPAGTGSVQLEVAQSWLDEVQIHRIEPEPASRELISGGVRYSFPVAADASTAKIIFHVEHEKAGSTAGRFALAGNQSVNIKQFVYP